MFNMNSSNNSTVIGASLELKGTPTGRSTFLSSAFIDPGAGEATSKGDEGQLWLRSARR
jgi:hypothetical protein